MEKSLERSLVLNRNDRTIEVKLHEGNWSLNDMKDIKDCLELGNWREYKVETYEDKTVCFTLTYASDISGGWEKWKEMHSDFERLQDLLTQK